MFHNHFPHTFLIPFPLEEWIISLEKWVVMIRLAWCQQTVCRQKRQRCLSCNKAKCGGHQRSSPQGYFESREAIRRNKMEGEGFRLLYLGLWGGHFLAKGIGWLDPLQYSCLESPVDRGAWWAALHGVAQSWTRLKWHSSSSSSSSSRARTECTVRGLLKIVFTGWVYNWLNTFSTPD